LLDPAHVGRLIDAHQSRREDYSRQLWGLMSLTLWLDVNRSVVSPAVAA